MTKIQQRIYGGKEEEEKKRAYHMFGLFGSITIRNGKVSLNKQALN